MAKPTKAEPAEQGDLASSSSIVSRLDAALVEARDAMKASHVSAPQLKNALSVLVKGVQNNPQFKERKLLFMGKQMFAGNGAKVVNKDDYRDLLGLLELANIAYEEDTEVLREQVKGHGYELNHHYINDKAGDVGYYIALDHSQKVLLLSIKGTSSFSDCITDCVAVTMPHACTPNDPFSGSNDEREIRCHEGILAAALKLLGDVEDAINQLALNAGYTVKIVGHSLGAGTAALLGILLRTRGDDRMRDPDFLHVWAFASPPVLDIASSLDAKSFITTVVNKRDLVPRCSIANLKIVTTILSNLAKELAADDGKPFAGIRGAISAEKDAATAKKDADKEEKNIIKEEEATARKLAQELAVNDGKPFAGFRGAVSAKKVAVSAKKDAAKEARNITKEEEDAARKLAQELAANDDKPFAGFRGAISAKKDAVAAKKDAVAAEKDAAEDAKEMQVPFETIIKIVDSSQSEVEVDTRDNLYVAGEVFMLYEKMDAPTALGEQQKVTTSASIVDGSHKVRAMCIIQKRSLSMESLKRLI
jgi:hypothetical protein